MELELVSVQKTEEEQKRNLRSQSTATSSTIMVVLPRELIYDILTRLSLSNLLCQCRFVCKDWLSITRDSKFKLMKSARNPIISGYLVEMDHYSGSNMSHYYSGSNMSHYKFISLSLVEDDNGDNQFASSLTVPSLSLDFIPTNVSRILASSSPHGLLCCTGWIDNVEDFSYSYYVCKPATREWQKIPSPRTNISHTLQMAFIVLHSDPLHYKLIHFAAGDHNEYDCETFDSNKWAWEVLDYNVDRCPPRPFTNYAREKGTLSHGAGHWLVNAEQEINVLDINDGSWKIIPIPTKDEQLREIYENRENVQKKLVECEGKIGLVYLSISKLWLELWLLEDDYYNSNNETARWHKNFRVDLKLNVNGYSIKVMDILLKKGTILLKVDDGLLWYNLKDESTSIALNPPNGFWFPRVHRLQTDLFPCGMVCKQ